MEFVLNAPYPDMLAWLSRASIGIHTMVDEHFGINVVEFMVRSLFVMECELIWIIGCGRDPCCTWLCWAFAKVEDIHNQQGHVHICDSAQFG